MMCLWLEPKVVFCTFLCGLLLRRMESQLIMGKQELQIVIKQTQVVFGQVIQTKCFDYTKVLVAFLLFFCSQGLCHMFMLVWASLIWKRIQFPVLLASGTCSNIWGLGVESWDCFFTHLNFHQVKREMLTWIFLPKALLFVFIPSLSIWDSLPSVSALPVVFLLS